MTGDRDALVADVALAISGAPFPSARSLAKARAVLAVPDIAEALALADHARAADKAGEDALAATGFGGLTVEDGGVVVTAHPPHDLTVAMAASLAESIGDAPNYSETAFSIEASPAGEFRPEFVLTVQRKSGRTPHELRVDAEDRLSVGVAERDALRGALRSVVNVLGPVAICTCGHACGCGLPDEAAEALRIAKEATRG